MTTTYTAPVADLAFLLNEVLELDRLRALPAFAAVDAALIDSVLAEGARFAEDILSPINSPGDVHGAALTDGRVEYPPGFAEAYAKYAADGWVGIDLPERAGGQGLPRILQAAFAEMTNGANVAFSMLPVTVRAAARLLLAHGGEELVSRYVPAMISGRCVATIAISESQAGSDVGRIQTTARAQADGTFKLTGTKIFISNGDNEFSEQIVHMALARTPGAPAGTRGISLFLVPKFTGEGARRRRNGVRVARVEHKMGLKASPTCVVEFDGADAVRIGVEGRGLQAMFAMVNTMRLEVALQGVAIASAATTRAVRYALQRLQGGAPDQPPVPIIRHADVRRMLLTMRARGEALRALTLEAALQLDIGENHPDPGVAARALGLAQLLLPICKACGTDAGLDIANLGLQVFGGYGYIADTGIEQYVRDVRVGSIYEGTNGIQAVDLVMRKLVADRAVRLGEFLARIRADVDSAAGDARIAAIRAAVARGANLLQQTSDGLLRMAGEGRSADVEAGAVSYLRLAGIVGGGWMWLRIAARAADGSALHRSKRISAAFYAESLMPEAEVLAHQALMGVGSAADLNDEHWLSGI
jgi:alkylation response protein AidB-like acyl-CoA dehydrogenase